MLEYLEDVDMVNPEKIAYFIQGGADCSALDREGNTVPHKVLMRTRGFDILGTEEKYLTCHPPMNLVKVIKILLLAGTDATVKNKDGQIAIRLTRKLHTCSYPGACMSI